METINNLLINIAHGIRGFILSYGATGDAADLLMTVVAAAILLGIIGFVGLYGIYAERKIAGFFQERYGPNRVGPYGLLQSVADGLKLIGKEDLRPAGADPWVFTAAPYVVLTPAVMVWAVLPFSKNIVAVDLNIGILYVVAVSSVTTLGLLMAGWGSNNKYSLLGGMRSVAQMISYEIPLVFSLMGVIMITGSLNLSDIVAAQERVWFIVPQILGFLVFVCAATAELNRVPFDLTEGESELTAGTYTEYSGMRWALFFAAEYANLFAVSAIATTFFLGGWQGPLLPPYLWFFIKTCGMIFFFMWLRWTLPRFRIDQVLNFGWKLLLPLSIANIFITGIGHYLLG